MIRPTGVLVLTAGMALASPSRAPAEDCNYYLRYAREQRARISECQGMQNCRSQFEGAAQQAERSYRMCQSQQATTPTSPGTSSGNSNVQVLQGVQQMLNLFQQYSANEQAERRRRAEVEAARREAEEREREEQEQRRREAEIAFERDLEASYDAIDDLKRDAAASSAEEDAARELCKNSILTLANPERCKWLLERARAREQNGFEPVPRPRKYAKQDRVNEPMEYHPAGATPLTFTKGPAAPVAAPAADAGTATPAVALPVAVPAPRPLVGAPTVSPPFISPSSEPPPRSPSPTAPSAAVPAAEPQDEGDLRSAFRSGLEMAPGTAIRFTGAVVKEGLPRTEQKRAMSAIVAIEGNAVDCAFDQMGHPIDETKCLLNTNYGWFRVIGPPAVVKLVDWEQGVERKLSAVRESLERMVADPGGYLMNLLGRDGRDAEERE